MQPSTQFPQNIPQPISTQPNPVKTRKSQKIMLICIAILTIITASIIGILIYSQFNNKIATKTNKSSQNSPLNNPLIMKIAEKLPIPKITFVPITLAPTLPASPTNPTQTINYPPLPQSQIPSNIFNTYNNSFFNFSLSYPAELTAQEKSHNLGITDISFYADNSFPSGPEYQILIYPKTIGKLINQDFDQLYALPEQNTQLMTSEATVPRQFTKINNRTINGLRTFNFRTTSDPPDLTEETEIGTYIELEGNILIISTEESNQTPLDYMLSTFKSD